MTPGIRRKARVDPHFPRRRYEDLTPSGTVRLSETLLSDGAWATTTRNTRAYEAECWVCGQVDGPWGPTAYAAYEALTAAGWQQRKRLTDAESDRTVTVWYCPHDAIIWTGTMSWEARQDRWWNLIRREG